MDTSAGAKRVVPASDFTRNFERYRKVAEREASVAVTSRGEITGYFVRPDEYESYLRFKAQGRSFATAELTAEKVEAISTTRMNERHAGLNALLD